MLLHRYSHRTAQPRNWLSGRVRSHIKMVKHCNFQTLNYLVGQLWGSPGQSWTVYWKSTPSSAKGISGHPQHQLILYSICNYFIGLVSLLCTLDLSARHIDLICGSVTTKLSCSKLTISGCFSPVLYHHYWLKGPNMQTLVLLSVSPSYILSIMFSPFTYNTQFWSNTVLTILIIN